MERGVWLAFERIDDTFADYGLWQAPLKFKGKRIPFKAILKEIKGRQKVIAILGRGYKLIPNAVVDKAVCEVSDLLGLKVKRRSDAQILGGRTVFSVDKGSHRAYWTMVFPKRYKFNRDRVQLGVQVRNSEDGSLGFGIDMFTFRLICSNGAIVRTGELEIKTYWKHTKGLVLDVGKIKNTILQIVDRGRDIIDVYRALQALKLNQELAERLAEKLPKKYLPDYIKARKEGVELLRATTVWEAYNDITASIWHSATASMFTKRTLNRQLHNIMAVSI